MTSQNEERVNWSRAQVKSGGSVGLYQQQKQQANGWRIGRGPSNTLVASGSGSSAATGMKLFRTLQDEENKRTKPPRKKKTTKRMKQNDRY